MIAKHIMMAGAAVALVLVTGCEKKPGGQVVAVVNGQEITQQDLNAELQGATIPPSADKKAVMAQVLQSVIDRVLLVQKAKQEGLDKLPTYLSQLRRAEDGLVVSLLTQKAAKAIALPDAAAVDTFITRNPSLFNDRKVYKLDQIVFDQPRDAGVFRQLESAHALNAVGTVLTSAGVKFNRGTSQLDTASIAPDAAAKIAALPAGEPFLVPDKGKVFVSVITATVQNPTPGPQARPAAIELMRQQALQSAMRKQLDAARSAAKIDYQPNFAPLKKPLGPGTPAVGAAPEI